MPASCSRCGLSALLLVFGLGACASESVVSPTCVEFLTFPPEWSLAYPEGYVPLCLDDEGACPALGWTARSCFHDGQGGHVLALPAGTPAGVDHSSWR